MLRRATPAITSARAPWKIPCRTASATTTNETSSRGIGWDTPSERSSGGDWISPSAFGHTGYTGTSIWMDPELDLFVILLTNRVHPSRENQKHIPLRRAVADAAVQAITDQIMASAG